MTRPKQRPVEDEPDDRIQILILHKVEKDKVEQKVRYLIRARNKNSGAIWWVGTFYWSRERVNKEYKEVFGSESCSLSFVSLEDVEAVYTLP